MSRASLWLSAPLVKLRRLELRLQGSWRRPQTQSRGVATPGIFVLLRAKQRGAPFFERRSLPLVQRLWIAQHTAPGMRQLGRDCPQPGRTAYTAEMGEPP
ncbi:hypothetical protein NDU88_001042 [Pleurodeles waltl]|uniref:Uncharacterized protein n=1 Tax=Pleurodeles waltl TaxID=8319 RepID=A0AAV7S8S7_PLEWA|nr:hypothetical protein NDU88_001042 [Pleurodeles waltl]